MEIPRIYLVLLKCKPIKLLMSEEQLIKSCLNKNREAQKLLYDTYSGQMYSICLRYCGERASAADALQNGFINVFQNLNTFNNTGSLIGWIRKVLINASLKEIRKRKRISFLDLEAVSDVKESSEGIDLPFDNYDYKRIIALVDTLPVGYRTIFSMSVIDELSHKEISEVLDISVNTSRSQLLRARNMLQNLIMNDSYLTKEYSLKSKIHTS